MNGSFLADHLPVTRDRTVFAEIEILKALRFALKIESAPLESVTPYARNPRKNADAVAKVAASIKEHGWRQPIVVDEERVIIAGHTRLIAAQRLGLDNVPVHIATGLTPQQVKAYRLADNRVAAEAEWDEDLLALELGELLDGGYNLDITGFDPAVLDKLLREGGDVEGEDTVARCQTELNLSQQV